MSTARQNDQYVLKEQGATSEINLNGHKWNLGWVADHNQQLTWSFDSLPRTSLSKNKTKIPFYPYSQKRQKTEQRSYTNLACLDSQSSFCKGCVRRDKRQDTTQQKVQNSLQKPTQAIFVWEWEKFQSFWYLNESPISLPA